MRIRQISIVVITLSLLIGGYFIMTTLAKQKEDKKKKTPPKQELKVHVKTVDYNDEEVSFKLNGRVNAAKTVDVVSEMSGKIIPGDIPLKKGNTFQKGTALFSIYKAEKELELKAQKSTFLSEMVNTIIEIEVDYTSYYPEFKNFFQSISLSTDLPDFPEIKDEQFKVFLANKNILTQYYTIKKAELELKRYTIYAPFSGSFSEVFSEAGTYANTGNTIAQIISSENTEIEVAVSPDLAGFIELGDTVKLKGGHGIVIRQTNFLEANTQSYLYYISSNSQKLKIGAYPVIEFYGMNIENSMKLPREALFKENQVYIVENGVLKTRQVTVIFQHEKFVFIKDLAEGEQVILEPLINASENTVVKIIK